MAATLVDANVLIDSFDPRSPWKAWADEQLIAALQDGAKTRDLGGSLGTEEFASAVIERLP